MKFLQEEEISTMVPMPVTFPLMTVVLVMEIVTMAILAIQV